MKNPDTATTQAVGVAFTIQSDLSDCASVRGTAVPAVHTGGTPVPRFTALCIARRFGAEITSGSLTASTSGLRNRFQGLEELFVLIFKHGSQVEQEGVLFDPSDNRR